MRRVNIPSKELRFGKLHGKVNSKKKKKKKNKNKKKKKFYLKNHVHREYFQQRRSCDETNFGLVGKNR